MWTSEIVQSLDNPTIADISVYRPNDGEKAGDNDKIDEADNENHEEVTNEDVLDTWTLSVPPSSVGA